MDKLITAYLRPEFDESRVEGRRPSRRLLAQSLAVPCASRSSSDAPSLGRPRAPPPQRAAAPGRLTRAGVRPAQVRHASGSASRRGGVVRPDGASRLSCPLLPSSSHLHPLPLGG